jgi:signal peptidase I
LDEQENLNSEPIIESDENQKKKKKSKPKEYFDALLFAAIIAIILKLFVIEAYRIPTSSMEETLLVGDFLLVNKFVYGITTPRTVPFTDIKIPYYRFPAFGEPKKGDVVVFDFPGNRDEIMPQEQVNFIKRLVGEPGDTIQIINQALFVNGKLFPNPEFSKFSPNPQNSTIVNLRLFPKNKRWNEDNYGPMRVPKKDDIIQLSFDNFEQWNIFITREGHNIKLLADSIIYIDGQQTGEYKVQRNYYFMMGDNRNNSLDSRFWGFMPDENIIGEALVIYWSWDPNIPFSRFGELFRTIRWNRIAKLIH